MQKLYRGELVEVIEESGSLVRVRYANGDESNWFPATLLKEPKPVKLRISRDADYEAAVTEGLTHFYTVDTFDRDEPKLNIPEYNWLKVELQSRGYVITVYSATKDAQKTAETLATLAGVTAEQALPFITVRDRKGGPKWNVDFANFPALNTSVRDLLEVNFGHMRAKGRKPNIRKIRIGSTKLVQKLISEGFTVTKRSEETSQLEGK
jgi:hypothetical protein